MEVIAFFIILWLAAEKARELSKSGAAKSRKAYMKRAAKKYPGLSKRQASRHALRHDTGHVLSQLFRGFPNARHGFAAGWHEGRQAHAHARAEHQRAKAEHLETRASLIPDLTAYRARQKAALEQIRRGAGPDVKAACTHAPAPCLNPPGCPCYCPDCVAALKAAPAREHRAGSEGSRRPIGVWGAGTDGSPVLLSEDYADEARAIRDGFEYGNCEVCGRGLDAHVIAPDPLGHAHAYCAEGGEEGSDGSGEETPSPSSTTEGTPMASEVTYDGVIRAAGEAVTAAEERAAEIARTTAAAEAQAAEARIAQRWADQAADNMQALNVDSATLGAMADHQDALAAAEKAHQAVLESLEQARQAQGRVTETAQNVESTLQRGHAGLAEAHQNAPVEAADREFYGEG